MTDFIHQSGNWFIPLLTFIFVSGIAGLIGAWNGWKTATYFFAWNLVALVTGVIAMDAMIDQTASSLDSVVDIKESTTVLALAKIVTLIALLLVTNILAFIFYWIFRKKLKAQIKENKKNGVSNASARWGGVTVAVITALPMSVGMAAITNVSSDQEEFDHFFNGTLKGITFGQLDGLYDDDKEALELISDSDTLDALKNLDDITKMTDSDREKVSQLLETKAGPEMLKAMAGSQIKDEDKSSYEDFLTNIGTPTNDQKIELSNEAQDRLKDTIIAIAIKDDATAPADMTAWWNNVKSKMFKTPTV